MQAHRSPILVGLLVFSASANVWMLTHRGTARTATVLPVVNRLAETRQPTVSLAPSAPRELLGSCQRQLAEARQALTTATEDQAQLIEPKKRFTEGVRKPGMETRISPLVDNALSSVRELTPYSLECRADLCQVRVSAPSRDAAQRAWQALNTDPRLKKDFDGFMREGGEPVVDVTTGKGEFDVDLYIFTRSAADATAEIHGLVEAFRTSGVVESCAAPGNDRGVLEVRLSVVPEGPTLSAAIGGSLAGTDVGKCISERLMEAVQQFKLPPGTSNGTVYASIASPHGE
jgi:hypothetical protein